jgi:hypothetical protein
LLSLRRRAMVTAKDVLVDTSGSNPADDSIRIVEVANPALYAEAHIPGAIGLTGRRTFRPGDATFGPETSPLFA